MFFDEVTSGMDPANRRHMWDVLRNNKKGRLIVLTTHFMVCLPSCLSVLDYAL